MSLLKNAINSIRMGVEDFQDKREERIISAVRNLHAGILLLFKEKLRLLSPADSNEVFVKGVIVPDKKPDGSIHFVGTGKKTATIHQIKERFCKLGVTIDWGRFRVVSSIRNDTEHYFSVVPRKLIEESLSKTFLIVRDFVTKELDTNPCDLLGQPTWDVLLKASEVFEKEKNECRALMKKIKWESPTLENAVEAFKCTECSSSLLLPIGVPEGDFIDFKLECRGCGENIELQHIAEVALSETMASATYRAMKDGGEEPLAICPYCRANAFIVDENRCTICGEGKPYNDCILCGGPLSMDEQDFGGYCSYCEHIMSKDD